MHESFHIVLGRSTWRWEWKAFIVAHTTATIFPMPKSLTTAKSTAKGDNWTTLAIVIHNVEKFKCLRSQRKPPGTISHEHKPVGERNESLNGM